MSEDRKHHPYGPSKLQNLEACPHYESLNSNSEAARLGTLQHTVTETGQDDLSLSDEEAAAAVECIEFFEEKKRQWDDARSREVAHLLRSGVSLSEAKLPEVIELSETYLPIDDERVEDFIGTTGGYLDKALIDYTGTKAMLFDWKFGQWQVEKADNNLQGIAYALGVFKAYPNVEHVAFYFKQPHIKSISHATWTRADVPALYLRILTVVSRARRARASGSFDFANPTIPGCLFCANIALCPAVTSMVLRVGQKFHAVDVPNDITPSKIHDPKNSTMGMRLASLVTAWAAAFRNLTTDRVLRGASPVPEGFFIAQGTGKRKIVDNDKFKTTALQYISEEVYNASTAPQLGKIELAIKNNAPRGQKDSTIDQFKDALIEAGAVEKGRSYPYLKAKSSEDSEATDSKE